MEMPFSKIEAPLWLESCAEPPIPIKDILRDVSSRPDEHCAAAWDYLDDRAPGEFMSLLTALATAGHGAAAIWRELRKHPVSHADNRFTELLALCVENAVRKARQ